MRPLRNPLTEVIVSSPSLIVTAHKLRDQLLRGGVDVLSHKEDQVMTNADARHRFESRRSNFMLFVDTLGILCYPGPEQTSLQTCTRTILASWNQRCLNLSPDDVELLTAEEHDQMIQHFSGISQLGSQVAELQNETAQVVSANLTPTIRYAGSELTGLRVRLQSLFTRISGANTAIVERYVYSDHGETLGKMVPSS